MQPKESEPTELADFLKVPRNAASQSCRFHVDTDPIAQCVCTTSVVLVLIIIITFHVLIAILYIVIVLYVKSICFVWTGAVYISHEWQPASNVVYNVVLKRLKMFSDIHFLVKLQI